MLGRLTAGPDNNKARAGPGFIPKSLNVVTIVTPTIVPKYIKAPNREAVKFPCIELFSKKLSKFVSGKFSDIILQTKIPANTLGKIIINRV